MTDPSSTVASVSGQVWSSVREPDLATGRCVVEREQLRFVVEDTTTVVAFDQLRDITRGSAPEPITHAAADILTVSYRRGTDTQLVSIAGDREDLDRLSTILFGLVLERFDPIVEHPSWTDEQRHLTPPERARLRTNGDALTLVLENATIDLPIAAITGYERVASGRYGGLPTTIGVYHEDGEAAVRTDITLETNPHVNLLGRFLTQEAGAELVSGAAIRTLIVDDEPGLAETIADLLGNEAPRYSFIPLSGPVEAIEYLAENPRIDCIVSDFKMDEMDGLEFLELVRQVRPNMPFILLTGAGSEAVAEAALGTGATDYIRKETLHEQASQIVDRVERAVARTRPHLLRDGAEAGGSPSVAR